MALALTAPAQIIVGTKITITGTGFTNSGQVKVSAISEDADALSVTGYFNAGGGGAITTDGAFEVVPQNEGHIDFTFTDVTAATSATARIQVFQD